MNATKLPTFTAAADKVLTDRAREALARASRAGLAPTKLTVFTRAKGAAEVERLAGDPTCRVERRAPGVYVMEALGKHVERLLALAEHLDAIDGGARVHGIPVEGPDARANVLFQAPRPLTAAHKAELTKLGVKIREERPDGDVEAEALGSAIASLARLPWAGPIEVRS